MKRIFLFIIIVIMAFISIFTSCKKENTNKQRILEQIGQELYFTDYRLDITKKNNMEETYKIVLYVDSFECSSCNINLFIWKDFIEEVKNEFGEKVIFLFYFQPQKNNTEIEYLINRDRFNHEVNLDEENKFGKENKLYPTINSECFLLNKKNRILLIGNPSKNLILWDLYKKTIRENKY